MTTTRREYVYDQDATKMSATDLTMWMEEMDSEGEAYTAGTIALIKDDGHLSTGEQGEYVHNGYRIAIAWGSDATWADYDSIDEAIDDYLNNYDEYASRN